MDQQEIVEITSEEQSQVAGGYLGGLGVVFA
jgi:hypothetical protein